MVMFTMTLDVILKMSSLIQRSEAYRLFRTRDRQIGLSPLKTTHFSSNS